MHLTVEQLIEQLKKMPKKAKVYWQDHDHSDYECNNSVGEVNLIDYNEYQNDVATLKAYKVDQNFILKGKVVMLRP